MSVWGAIQLWSSRFHFVSLAIVSPAVHEENCARFTQNRYFVISFAPVGSGMTAAFAEAQWERNPPAPRSGERPAC